MTTTIPGELRRSARQAMMRLGRDILHDGVRHTEEDDLEIVARAVIHRLFCYRVCGWGYHPKDVLAGLEELLSEEAYSDGD